MQSEELKRKSIAFDDMSPDESIGAFGGSGQWVELCTVRDLRALEAALSAAEPVNLANAIEQGVEVLKACSAPDEWDTESATSTVRQILELVAPVEPPAPSVAVKALEWRSGSTQHRQVASVFDRPMYEVGIGNGRWYWLHNWNGLALRRVDSENEALAAAQADYEARILSALSAQEQDVAGTHPDDLAVNRFALAMKAKLAQKRAEGRGGWDNPDECSVERLSELLIRHIEKGDPIDVGNFAMMIHQRGGRISR